MPTAICSSATATDVRLPCIRDALAADLPAITRIYAHEVLHGAASYETVPPDLAAMQLRHAAIAAAGYPYLVAEVDGECAGFAFASSYRPRDGYRWTVEDSVYVDSAFQGQGVGRALLAELIAQCTGLGYRQMIAVIGDGTNHASIALHEGAGFTTVARFAGMGWKLGRWLENVQMQRSLADGSSSPPLDSAR